MSEVSFAVVQLTLVAASKLQPQRLEQATTDLHGGKTVSFPLSSPL